MWEADRQARDVLAAARVKAAAAVFAAVVSRSKAYDRGEGSVPHRPHDGSEFVQAVERSHFVRLGQGRIIEYCAAKVFYCAAKEEHRLADMNDFGGTLPNRMYAQPASVSPDETATSACRLHRRASCSWRAQSILRFPLRKELDSMSVFPRSRPATTGTFKRRPITSAIRRVGMPSSPTP
jgi:hypothetical protein